MMYRVEISSETRQDLIRIQNYLETEFGRETSNQVIKKIIKKIKTFETFPLMGKPLSLRIDFPTDYMFFVIEKNTVFYRVEDRSVRIIRILDRRRDFIRVIFDK